MRQRAERANRRTSLVVVFVTLCGALPTALAEPMTKPMTKPMTRRPEPEGDPATNTGGGGVTVTFSRAYGREAVRLRNRTAEIVIVPSMGRVMGFGVLDSKNEHTPSPFWSHPDIDQHMQPDAEGWTNYGGEKAWPAPQSDWLKIAGKGWPPPKGFDALPYTATIEHGKVRLVSTVDPHYGIRVRRAIALDPGKPVMSIETSYEKVQGPQVRVAVWTIAQLRSPERLFVFLPEPSSAAFPRGYSSLLPDAPSSLTVAGRLLSLARDARNKTMISSDGRSLLWVGSGPDLLVEDVTPGPTRQPGERPSDAGEWPNHGARSQIYTSPDGDGAGDGVKDAYVELELLGRLRDLAPRQTTSAWQRYTLIPRTLSDPNAEAKKVFGVR